MTFVFEILLSVDVAISIDLSSLTLKNLLVSVQLYPACDRSEITLKGQKIFNQLTIQISYSNSFAFWET